MQMASLREEIGCTGQVDVQQWRAARFKNLPVPVNLDRLGAFVGSRHFFRAFVTCLRATFSPSSCCSSSRRPSSEDAGPDIKYMPSSSNSCPHNSYHSATSSDVTICNSSSDGLGSDPSHDVHEDFHDAHERMHTKPHHCIEGSVTSVCSSADSSGL